MIDKEYINQATNEWVNLFINKSNLNSSDIDNLKNCIKTIIETTIVWKEKQMLDKSCEWLEDMAIYYNYWEVNGDTYEKEICCDTDKMINDFKKSMEE